VWHDRRRSDRRGLAAASPAARVSACRLADHGTDAPQRDRPDELGVRQHLHQLARRRDEARQMGTEQIRTGRQVGKREAPGRVRHGDGAHGTERRDEHAFEHAAGGVTDGAANRPEPTLAAGLARIPAVRLASA